MRSVELIVHAHYPLTGQKRRARQTKALLVRDAFPIEVPVLSLDEAPEVIRVRERLKMREISRRLGPAGMLGQGPSPRGGRPATLATAQRLLDQHHAESVFGTGFGAELLPEEFRTGITKVTEIPIDVDLVTFDGREAFSDRLRDDLQDCVFVDDMLHRANPIPFIQYAYRNNTISLDLKADVRTGLPHDVLLRGFAFSCLEQEKAQFFGNFIAAKRPGNNRFVREDCVDILSVDIDALKRHPFPTHYHNASAAIRHVFQSSNSCFDLMSAETLRSLADLKDLHDQLDPQRPDVSLRANDLMQQLHDDGFGIPKKNSSSRASLLRHSEIALKALEISDIPALIADVAPVHDEDLDTLSPI